MEGYPITHHTFIGFTERGVKRNPSTNCGGEHYRVAIIPADQFDSIRRGLSINSSPRASASRSNVGIFGFRVPLIVP